MIYVWNYLLEDWDGPTLTVGCRYHADEHCIHTGKIACKACGQTLKTERPPRSIFVGHDRGYDQFLLTDPITCSACGAVNEQLESPCVSL